MNRWLAGARPRTLPAAVVPVVVGTAVAFDAGQVVWWRAATALVVSVALQIGTNYANDYSDGVRGTDDARVGPVRLVASGLASPGAVKAAALLFFAVAGVAGAALAVAVGPELIVVGAACIAAGWYYTGGHSPYGYRGFGELAVFIFFGLVAVIGSAYIHLETVTPVAIVAAVPVGALATALLVVNNLRDIVTDKVAGKRTLAVRLGPRKTSDLYSALVLLPFPCVTMISLTRLPVMLAFLALPFAVKLVPAVTPRTPPPELVKALGDTARFEMVFGGLLALGLSL